MQRVPLGQLEMDGSNPINQQSMSQLLQSCNALHAVSAANFATLQNANANNNANNNETKNSIGMPLQPRKIQPNTSPVNDENAGPCQNNNNNNNIIKSSAQTKLDLADLNQLTALRRNRAPTMSRRNERERNRVRYLNFTFDVLRQHLPRPGSKGKAKKMSKVDTLRGAIDYIRDLQDVLGDGLTPLSTSGSSNPGGALSASSLAGTESEADSLSPAGSPHYSGDTQEDAEGLSDQEDDLTKLADWFC